METLEGRGCAAVCVVAGLRARADAPNHNAARIAGRMKRFAPERIVWIGRFGPERIVRIVRFARGRIVWPVCLALRNGVFILAPFCHGQRRWPIDPCFNPNGGIVAQPGKAVKADVRRALPRAHLSFAKERGCPMPPLCHCERSEAILIAKRSEIASLRSQ